MGCVRKPTEREVRVLGQVGHFISCRPKCSRVHHTLHVERARGCDYVDGREMYDYDMSILWRGT